jgi:hypothetical protein
MLQSYLIGIGGFILLAVLWTVVQSLWRNTFSDEITEEDVLAGRTSCGSCGCTTACTNKKATISTEKL